MTEASETIISMIVRPRKLVGGRRYAVGRLAGGQRPSGGAPRNASLAPAEPVGLRLGGLCLFGTGTGTSFRRAVSLETMRRSAAVNIDLSTPCASQALMRREDKLPPCSRGCPVSQFW